MPSDAKPVDLVAVSALARAAQDREADAKAVDSPPVADPAPDAKAVLPLGRGRLFIAPVGTPPPVTVCDEDGHVPDPPRNPDGTCALCGEGVGEWIEVGYTTGIEWGELAVADPGPTPITWPPEVPGDAV